MDFMADVQFWHWLILGLVLIGLEVMAPSTFLLWPSISAFLVGLLVAVFPGFGFSGQLILFAIMAVGSTVVWQIYFKKSTEATDRPKLNRRASQYIGRKVVLREDFQDGSGYVSIDDTRWRAASEDGKNYATGVRVEVIAAEGVTLKVKEIADA